MRATDRRVTRVPGSPERDDPNTAGAYWLEDLLYGDERVTAAVGRALAWLVAAATVGFWATWTASGAVTGLASGAPLPTASGAAAGDLLLVATVGLGIAVATFGCARGAGLLAGVAAGLAPLVAVLAASVAIAAFTGTAIGPATAVALPAPGPLAAVVEVGLAGGLLGYALGHGYRALGDATA